MRMHFTEHALQAIKRRIGETPGNVKLIYDTDGCGCAVNGVPSLWLVNEETEFDRRIDNDDLSVWIDQRHEVFFEDTLHMDADPRTGVFKLSSPQQIYGTNVQLTDKR